MSQTIEQRSASRSSHETDKNDEKEGRRLNCVNSASSKEQTDGEISVDGSMAIEGKLDDKSEISENYLVDQLSIFEKGQQEERSEDSEDPMAGDVSILEKEEFYDLPSDEEKIPEPVDASPKRAAKKKKKKKKTAKPIKQLCFDIDKSTLLW